MSGALRLANLIADGNLDHRWTVRDAAITLMAGFNADRMTPSEAASFVDARLLAIAESILSGGEFRPTTNEERERDAVLKQAQADKLADDAKPPRDRIAEMGLR